LFEFTRAGLEVHFSVSPDGPLTCINVLTGVGGLFFCGIGNKPLTARLGNRQKLGVVPNNNQWRCSRQRQKGAPNMSQAIGVDDEVYAQLQAEAQPFVDTPNSVLRRKFGLPSAPVRTAVKPPPGYLTEKAQKVLAYIQAAGGPVRPQQVQQDLGLSSPGFASYTLDRLTSLGLARRLAGKPVQFEATGA
jgi:hypothetical protein